MAAKKQTTSTTEPATDDVPDGILPGTLDDFDADPKTAMASEPEKVEFERARDAVVVNAKQRMNEIVPPPSAPLEFIEHKLKLPLLKGEPAGYCSNHVQVGAMSPLQAKNLRRLTVALISHGACLLDNRPVDGAPSAMRWLLENMA